jgi:hypothetical protein
MMKRKFGKYLLAIGVMIVVLAVAFPAVGAYEGHLVDVKAHDTIPVTKEARLATPTEINSYIPSSCNPGIYNPATITAWDNIPKDTCVAWIVTMSVKNRLDYTMYNVSIFDEFNKNVKIKKISASPDNVNIQNENRIEYWDIGTLQPNGTACLTLIVWTDCYQESWVEKSDCPIHHDCNNNDHNNNFTSCDYSPDEDNACDCHQECEWKCKTLAKSDDNKYYLQSVHGPCDLSSHWDFVPDCVGGSNCEPSGINMEWKDANGVHHSYTGGPFLQVTVY